VLSPAQLVQCDFNSPMDKTATFTAKSPTKLACVRAPTPAAFLLFAFDDLRWMEERDRCNTTQHTTQRKDRRTTNHHQQKDDTATLLLLVVLSSSWATHYAKTAQRRHHNSDSELKRVTNEYISDAGEQSASLLSFCPCPRNKTRHY